MLCAKGRNVTFGARLTVILLMSLAPYTAWAWPARVIPVVDGDTLTVEPLAGGEHACTVSTHRR